MARMKLEDLVLDDDETDDESADDSASKEVATPSISEPEAVTVTNLDDTDTAESSGESRRKQASPPKRRRSRTTGDRPALATVYTTSETFRALRNHVQQRKAKGEIVSYGLVTLLAVQEHRDTLSRLWAEESTGSTAAADASDDDLFGITIRQAAPKKVPWQLHGASPAQVETLDHLADEWGAPSRSVLVQEALNRYLEPAPKKRRPAKRQPQNPDAN